MTGSNLVTLLGDRLEDSTHARFTNVEKINALNQAQDFVVSTLPLEKLRLLESTVIISGITGGVTSVSNLSILRDHLVSVQNDTSGNTDHGTIIHHEQREVTSSYVAPCYLLGTDLYIPDYWTSIKLTFLQEPNDIGDNSALLPLTDMHYNIVLDMAESILWNTDNKPQRAQYAEQRAAAQLQTI